MKRVLVVGGGAREHALARALKNSREEVDLLVFAASRNPGLTSLASKFHPGSLGDVRAICRFASENKADFAVIGPEGPLAAGLVDALQEIGVPSVGPIKDLARLESSKTFTRELLKEFGIPGSPAYQSFSNSEGLEKFLHQFEDGFVIKPDGLTGGKGVQVMGDHFFSTSEGMQIVQKLLSEGERVLIEEKLVGQEFSLMSFCDGQHCLHMPVVQDHKRAFNNDTGPNTGGMGTYSMPDGSMPFLEKSDIQAAREINEAVAHALFRKTGKEYKGVLYGGFMATRTGIRLIEYNARLGDPEAMNVLSLIPGKEANDVADFLEICEAIIQGNLNRLKVQWKPLATVCKYAVPEGYPDKPIKGIPIDTGDVNQAYASIYYASVEEEQGQLLLAGSRAVAVLAMHSDVAEAEKLAEAEIQKIHGPVFHRSDIGTEALIRQKTQMMRAIRSGLVD